MNVTEKMRIIRVSVGRSVLFKPTSIVRSGRTDTRVIPTREHVFERPLFAYILTANERESASYPRSSG